MRSAVAARGNVEKFKNPLERSNRAATEKLTTEKNGARSEH
jgi:hypothetical protein